MPFGIPLESGSPITIQDEGLTLTPNVSKLDFTGAGVTASAMGTEVTVSITGGGSTSIKENNVFISSDWVVGGGTTTITLATTPVAGSVKVYVNKGRELTNTYDPTFGFTISGNDIIFPYVFDSSWVIVVDYRD